MKNLKSLCGFINLTKNKSFYSVTSVRYYSLNSCNKCFLIKNNKSCSVLVNNFNSILNINKNKELCSKNIFTSTINHAKSKDRGSKEKKKPKTSKIDLRALNEVFDSEELTNQMNQTIENMKADFTKNLTLRSTSGSLEQIPVAMDGKEYQIQELAQIARKPKLIVLNAAAFPTAIPHILKAIEKSGLNINPQQDGTTIFCPIPKVTKEHRENLSKNAKAIFIRHRDEIKDIRNKAIKTLKKRKDISEDTIRNVQGQVEALCEKYLKDAENVLDMKQNELLGSLD